MYQLIFLCCIILSIFKDISPVLIPKDLNSLFAFLNNSDACSKDFDGIQPIFKQVPPSVPLNSIHATFFQVVQL